MKALKPLTGNILVEIRESFDDVVYIEKEHDTKTKGLCIAVGDDSLSNIVNKTVYWRKYEDGEHIILDNKEYAFISSDNKILQGYEE